MRKTTTMDKENFVILRENKCQDATNDNPLVFYDLYGKWGQSVPWVTTFQKRPSLWKMTLFRFNAMDMSSKFIHDSHIVSRFLSVPWLLACDLSEFSHRHKMCTWKKRYFQILMNKKAIKTSYKRKTSSLYKKTKRKSNCKEICSTSRFNHISRILVTVVV